MTAALDAALAYAAAAVPVFPCVLGGKTPLTAHGLHDATCDAATIRGWWRRWPSANVALPTGIGFDVLDVDVKAGAPGLASMERLRLAGLLRGCFRIVRTPSGGLHLHFAPSGEGNHTLAKAGIDYRGAGGYVVAPPSGTAAGEYVVLDERDTGMALPFRWAVAVNLLAPAPPRRPAPAHGRSNLVHMAEWMRVRPEGSRNCALYWAACRALESGADPEPLIEAATAAGLPRYEAERTVASALRGAR